MAAQTREKRLNDFANRITTPTRKRILYTSTPRNQIIQCTTDLHSSNGTPKTPIHDSVILPFKLHRGHPRTRIEDCVDKFLTSPTFELICIQAVQLAAVLPRSPPPLHFISFDFTPMHHWYQAILMEFVEIFMRRLQLRNSFPRVIVAMTTTQTAASSQSATKLTVYDDEDAFNAEATAHINAILAGFNVNLPRRSQGSTEGLSIDPSQPNALVACWALREAIALSPNAPKKNWRDGEAIHAEYRRRLRMFESGVMRLVAEREESRWMLGLPGALKRGVSAYKEYYIACLRLEVLRFKGASCMTVGLGKNDIVVGREEKDVFS